jgi:single-strand DNA-binding protein
VTDLGLAVHRRFRTQAGDDREETNFLNVSLFGKQAETAARYLRKGRSVFIEGRLKYDVWKSKDGQNRSRISIVAERFQFLGGERSGPSGEMGDAPERFSGRRDTPREPAAAGDEQVPIEDEPAEPEAGDSDDLPF